MFGYRAHRWFATKLLPVLALVVLITLGSPLYAKRKQPHQQVPGPVKRDLQWNDFDLSKIVWPQPPSIARVKVIDRYVGERVEPGAESIARPKVKWMDRLAGAQPIEERTNKKIPFQLIAPLGLAIDSKGLVYVADQRVGAIFIFDQKTKETQLIRNGHEANFALLNGLALDDDDRLFVADGKLKRIVVFSPSHEVQDYITEGLVHPVGVAVDVNNRLLYVVDLALDQVMVYDADSYKLIRKLGVAGRNHESTVPGEFAKPGFVAVDRSGLAYITDTWNNRVEVFDAEGTFVRTFGKAGDGPGEFQRPKGIAIDSDGHIWVADSMSQRVQVFSNEGRLLTYFGTFGGYPGQFSSLVSVAIDKNNRVFTAEQQPGRIQIFQYVTDAEALREKTRLEDEKEKRVRQKDSWGEVAPKSSERLPRTGEVRPEGSADNTQRP